MVEIEQVPEERPTLETTDDGWQKLMGDDLLMKVIEENPLEHGKKPEMVNPSDAVLINVIGRLASDKDASDGVIFLEAKGWLVIVGDGDVLPAIEMATRFLQTGQTGRVWSHSKYAFGQGTRSYDNGNVIVPPNTAVQFDVSVISIVMDTSRLNPYFTIQKALTKKNMANDIYLYEWCPPPSSSSSNNKLSEEPSCEASMKRAVRLYTKAAKEMETLSNGTYFNSVEADHPQRLQCKQLLLDCLNNVVAVHLKQKEHHQAKKAAVEVLKQDPRNLKGLLRAAKSSLLDPASTLEEVQAALKAAEAQITYKNPVEEKELKKLKQQYKTFAKEYKAQSKAMFGNKLQTSNALSSDDDQSLNEEQELGKKDDDDERHVSFSSGTKDAKNVTPTKNGMGNEEAIQCRDDKQWWMHRLFLFVLQIVVPLTLWFVYRKVFATSGSKADEARVPEQHNGVNEDL